MSNVMYCKYCGCKTTNLSGICNPCNEKLMLIRKIRAIVFGIKRDAERERKMRLENEKAISSENERMMENEQTGDHTDTQTVQRIAS